MDQTSPDYVAASRQKGKARQAAKARKPKSGPGLAAIIWPQRSLLTNREVPGPGALEPNLWSKLQFLSDPLCARCGAPFEIAVDPAQVCAACLASPPLYDRARAALIYGDTSRDLVLSLKYQGRRDGLSVLGGWMANAGRDLISEADLIVPVPLHYFRLVRRGFNQSAWLAAALSRSSVARASGVKLSVDTLKRIKATPTQGGLSAEGRRRNVQGAFAVRPSRAARIKDRRVLLVDDVLTTGATVEACTRALRRAGAACVDVVTLARVAGPRAVPI